MSLNILSLNVCGLKSKLNPGVFEQYIVNYDLVALSETKLNSNIDNIVVQCFTIFKKCRKEGKSTSGGIAILVQDSVAMLV